MSDPRIEEKESRMRLPNTPRRLHSEQFSVSSRTETIACRLGGFRGPSFIEGTVW